MRRHKPDVSRETDLILVAGLIGLHPRDISRYTLIVATAGGDILARGDACCTYHDLQAVEAAARVSLATLTPCASEHG